MIDESQYGLQPGDIHLPPAPYKLATKLQNGRGVYSFCMCPGGYVVNASSEAGRLVVNGMSYSAEIRQTPTAPSSSPWESGKHAI